MFAAASHRRGAAHCPNCAMGLTIPSKPYARLEVSQPAFPLYGVRFAQVERPLWPCASADRIGNGEGRRAIRAKTRPGTVCPRTRLKMPLFAISVRIRRASSAPPYPQNFSSYTAGALSPPYGPLTGALACAGANPCPKRPVPQRPGFAVDSGRCFRSQWPVPSPQRSSRVQKISRLKYAPSSAATTIRRLRNGYPACSLSAFLAPYMSLSSFSSLQVLLRQVFLWV